MQTPSLPHQSVSPKQFGGPSSAAEGGGRRGPSIRSCYACRERKVKCSKERPCHNCARAGIECRYPPGRGRAPKRPRGRPDGELMERLTRLEAIIKRFESASKESPGGSAEADSDGSSPLAGQIPHAGAGGAPKPDEAPDTSSSIHQHLGWLKIGENKSHYVRDALWASLSTEIEELRDILQHSPSEDETEHAQAIDYGGSLALGSNAALLGYRSLAQSLRPLHPLPPLSQDLFQVFTKNVVPMVHIFHMPTTEKLFYNSTAAINCVDRNAEALLFAIYYSATISLSPEQCLALTGGCMSRDSLLRKYRFAVEQALARADLLNTESFILLQAAVLFLSALRNEDDSRLPWSLTALIYHIAQAMGLHRDGSVFGLKPINIELRRRLWHHIHLLDLRSEYQGYEPIFSTKDDGSETRLPLNVNDSDLTSDMTETPPVRQGFTEMTFCVIRSETLRLGSNLALLQPSTDVETFKAKVAHLENYKQRLQNTYLQYFDLSNPFQRLTHTITELITARMWLMVHYPLCHKRAREINNASLIICGDMRDEIFAMATRALELATQMLNDPGFACWIWQSRTHLQWHALALVLSEICSRPPSSQCERAWQLACQVFDVWEAKEGRSTGRLDDGASNTTKGLSLLRLKGIRKLMAKARGIRELQRAAEIPNTESAQVKLPAQDLAEMNGEDLMHSLLFNDVSDLVGPLGEFPNIPHEDFFDSIPDLAVWNDSSRRERFSDAEWQ